MNLEHGQSKIQILAEAPFGELVLQFAAGGGDGAKGAFARLGIADRRDLELLDHAQQFDLHVGWNVGRFVKEDRGPVGQFEQTWPGSVGAGERPFDVTEQLALDQRRTERGQIDRHEGPLGSQRVAMNRAGDQLLAGAALAGDQHRAIAAGNQSNPLEDVLHGRAGPEQFVGRAGREFGNGGRAARIAGCQRPLDDRGGLFQIERLGQIVERAVSGPR